MSYVTIYQIEANGDVVECAEGSNNHVFAPIVWDMLGYKYGFMNKALHPYSLADPGLNKLWTTWPDPKMTRMEQVLLGATFDRVWIKREMLPELIEACEWFLREHVLKPHPALNWKTNQMEDSFFDSRALAGCTEGPESLRRKGIIPALKEIYEDPTARGAAFNCCSAVAPFWSVKDMPMTYPVENEPDHRKDEDCTIRGEDGECLGCGVTHSTPCEDCGGTGFHKETCDEYEWDYRPWNIDKDVEQPRGEYRGARPWELSAGMLDPALSQLGPFKRAK